MSPLGRIALARLRAPFATDGCTNWPDGPWLECCEAHDRYYRYGSLAGLPRKRGDRELRDCVICKGYRISAELMYRGVRMFGGPIWRRYALRGNDA